MVAGAGTSNLRPPVRTQTGELPSAPPRSLALRVTLQPLGLIFPDARVGDAELSALGIFPAHPHNKQQRSARAVSGSNSLGSSSPLEQDGPPLSLAWGIP